MQKQPVRLWITVLLIGWCFDFLFYKHTPGISFAIYAAITLAGGVILLWLDGFRPAKKTLILVPLILYFAVMTFVRVEAMSAFLSYAFSLFLMAGFAVTYRGGEWLRYSVAEYISRALGLLGSMLGSPLFFAAESQRLKREAGQEEKRPGAVWSIVRGLLFAIPVLVFFAALLSSADMIFAQRLATITALFRLENLPEYIFRAIYIAILAYVLAGVYLHAANRSSDEKLLGIDKPVVPPFLGFPESTVVLGSVVLLFAAFVVIQFQYFFGGQANIQIEGYTFAEYARKGFGVGVHGQVDRFGHFAAGQGFVDLANPALQAGGIVGSQIGNIQYAAAFFGVMRNQPGNGGDIRIPRPDGLVGVAVGAGAFEQGRCFGRVPLHLGDNRRIGVVDRDQLDQQPERNHSANPQQD